MSSMKYLMCVAALIAGCRSTVVRNFSLSDIAMDLIATVPGNCYFSKEDEIESDLYSVHKVGRVEDITKIQSTINITCRVGYQEKPWNWTTFQKVVYSFADAHSGFYIGLTVACSSGGSVVMTRPHEARLIRSLSIVGCEIHSYNVLNPAMVTKQKNDLEHFLLKNCIRYFRLSDILEEVKGGNVSCVISPRLVYYHQHNVSNKYEPDVKLMLDDRQLLVKYDKQKVCRCPALEYLELSGHDYSKETNDASILFPGWRSQSLYPKLKVLVLSRNHMKQVPYHLYSYRWWTQFGALEQIDFSRNQITSLPFRHRQPNQSNPRLSVEMTSNAIELVTEDEVRNLFEFWPNTVSLVDNPIVCNCSISDVVTLLNQTKIMDNSHSSIYDRVGNSVQCAYPGNMAGLTLLDLTQYTACDNDLGYFVPEKQISSSESVESFPMHLPEGSEKYIALICGVVIGSALITALVLWFLKERKHARASRLSYHHPSPIVDNKTFDAFISYSSLDEAWVMDKLYTFLVSKGFQVCLHHKDFIPGACISENIINSIDRSRHTVLVLSPNFLVSEWCLLEFRKAFQQSLMEKNGHLIVVVKESVDQVSLENDMRHFMQTHTYLSLSDGHFWEKLNRSLT
ncbi:toll-like receptor 6 [Argopecten irradians]|uniref:toll-like receptor 6 n=1 Tax=Argopecten irradians TaxID=31199 RepID=UPI00371D77E1